MAQALVDTLRTLAFGGISGTYATVGSVLAHNWRVFRITNNTNGDLFISLDGTNDNLFVPAGSFVLYDLSSNAPPISESDNLVLKLGTQFYAKQSTAPTSGALWIEGIYAKGE